MSRRDLKHPFSTVTALAAMASSPSQCQPGQGTLTPSTRMMSRAVNLADSDSHQIQLWFNIIFSFVTEIRRSDQCSVWLVLKIKNPQQVRPCELPDPTFIEGEAVGGDGIQIQGPAQRMAIRDEAPKSNVWAYGHGLWGASDLA